MKDCRAMTGERSPAGNETGRATIPATVAICTANRSALLAETLAVALTQIDPRRGEIVVVDNGSNDDTPRLLAELTSAVADAGRPAGYFRAVRETRLGLSAARNRAIREARGELLLFLDDDALPAPGWLESYVEAFRDPRVGAAGGPVEPIFDGALPAWLDGRFLPYLSAWDRGPGVVPLVYNELPRGANMAFRRKTFALYGDFLEQLGRKGASLRSCEEIEYCLRLERAGEKILYLPTASVRHHVATSRLSLDWMSARFSAQGFSEAILDWRHAGVRGLRTGLRRVARLDTPASPASSPGDDPLAHCLRHTARGYRRGALYALFCVARYQPAGEVALTPFEPAA
jgi:glucosyl-dolichyl phosphate glucuronosyltransferase